MKSAYTIGQVTSYDLALQDLNNPPIKWGVHPEDDPLYPGGCVWRTPEEAALYIVTQGTALGFRAAVYELLLPTDWETDVSSSPAPAGYHHLLHDAQILRKVIFQES